MPHSSVWWWFPNTGDDDGGVNQLRIDLNAVFNSNDLANLRDFLGFDEVSRGKLGTIIN